MHSNLYLSSNKKSNSSIRNELCIISTDGHADTLLSKVNLTTRYQDRYIKRIFDEFSQKSPENTSVICDFIIAEQNEINIKESTKEWKIKNLILLSRFLNNKSFKDMTKEDILDYLRRQKKARVNRPFT